MNRVGYVVASTEDLSLRTDVLGAPTTYYQATVALDAHLAAKPDDVGSVQVLPEYEATP